ncbi:MAG: metalloregulator ArsR/SmtB family transcription factor [Alphaproteobacteria bacterium]
MASDRLSLTLSALADPTRRGILARLAQGEASVTALAEPYAMSLAAVSKHLKVLENAGLVTRGRSAQWRPCRLDPAPLAAVSNWLEQYRAQWEARLDRLEDHVRALQDGEDMDGR